jgi:hypothetical protein
VLGTPLRSGVGFAIKHGIHSGRRGGCRDRDVAHASIGRGSIGIVRKTKQLLGLLLLESTHLILEYLALEKTLTLVLETLELDTRISQVEESRGTLFPLLGGLVIMGG